MKTIRVEMPDAVVERMTVVAQARGLTVEELVLRVCQDHVTAAEVEERFRRIGQGGDVADALAVLDRLDEEDDLRA